MNFYSDDIVNSIIDNEEIEDILEKLDEFYVNVKTVFYYFSYRKINISYMTNLIDNKRNKFVFYCMDTEEFRIGNCPCAMIYNKTVFETEIVYYMLLICTKNKFKNMGYARMLLDGFVERIRRGESGVKPIKIVLSSVEESVTFYESYGFRWTRESILRHPKLMKFETYEEGKEYFMMELIVDVS